MLQITIPAIEMWDEINNEFVSTKEQTLQLEHSLVSLSKWESKWRKPYLSTTDMTYEEAIDYIRCMTLTQHVNPDVYKNLTAENLKEVQSYINAPMTATTFSEDKHTKRNREVITAEVIYYWLISQQIPIECQKWHLNRLLALIRVCNVKNAPTKKMSKRDILSQNAALNAARRKRMGSRG